MAEVLFTGASLDRRDPNMNISAQQTLTDLRDCLDAYRTCEVATMTKSGTPFAWPTVHQVAADSSSIVITTSIGLPQKAYNVRRDPRVALLFSDPTGSGRSDLPQVLVQGTATCPDVLHTSPAGLEDYWNRLALLQPASRSSSSASHWLMDWYYMRLVITITPSTVTVRPPLGQVGQVSPISAERRDHSPYAEVVRRLPTYRSAVLAVQRGDGLPSLRRVQLTADPVNRLLGLEDPTGEPLSAGPASLLLHGHDEQLWNMRNCGAVGDLAAQGRDWAFRPVRFVPGSDRLVSVATVRSIRRMRRAADRYLDRRGLERPQIAWGEYRRIMATPH